ncbi:F0F1 ATP synthase subunit A [Albibacterium bauzanense]|uniref:ATP synthase subunit a n=1 Tax=Albibacterium bauzanense TaxID=653929 RepID=A0A4R1M189_9SPHI|nr:F0F1 ATP synthase subunit A [Albibacterium bauzanense]TCK83403.1 ATP synthase F0 subcomplex A subunit [Albibacterium bauzanense]
MEFSHIFNSRGANIIAFFALLFTFSTSSAQNDIASTSSVESESLQELEKENGLDINNFILHHIADAHEFHFFGEGENWKGIYFPIILLTDQGLVTFSAKNFQLDHDGVVVVEKNGQRFVRYHNKIYYASEEAEHGSFLSMTTNEKGEHVVSNAKPWDFSITKNVFTILLSIAALCFIFISVANSYKKREGKAPKGLQSLIEPIIIFVRDDIAKPNLGYKYERYMPYLLTVFFFIWFNNMFGLVPFFPGGANVTGNIAVTMVLASITLLITLFSGNKAYWGHIFRPNVPWWLYPLMIPVEIIGVFTKPIALMIRLFANITAGHILVLALISLIFVFESVAVAPASILFVLFISLIELLVAFIQAFIFTILSALFIGMAIEEHH